MVVLSKDAAKKGCNLLGSQVELYWRRDGTSYISPK